MGTDAPRAPLDQVAISEKISQYWRVKVVEVTGSTQEDLAVAVTINEAHSGDVIAAEYQSRGRGRLDRSFDAAPHSALMFSFYVEPKREKSYWSFLTLLSGMAVKSALNSLDAEIPISIKWPNDLFIGTYKTAGLIAQTAGNGVVIGIGINVGMNESELPVPTATSLAINGFKSLDRNEILGAILNQFENLFTLWDAGDDFVDQYIDASATVGTEVKATLPGGEIKRGLVRTIDHHGALIFDDGVVITAGDIVHLR